jgi:phenylalanyl-tRNA synthetase beta chain
MRIPMDWLGEFVDLPADAEGLAERLTVAGLEVERIERSELPAGVVAARIEELRAHPTTASLWVCRVAVGEGRVLEVVCGAPDVEVGKLVPAALPGALLSDGTVAERDVHGVLSRAVLCSERDLGLSERHDGLLDLGPSELGPAVKGLTPGMALAEVLTPLVVLDLAVSPNRGDCQSVLGVAREVAALWGAKVKTRRQAKPVADDDDAAFSVAVEAHDLCGWYCVQRFYAPSAPRAPLWMRRRLLACGVRPISPAVDVTNYVMLELGQPLHAFDHERVGGARLTARRARPGEVLRLLDGRDVSLDAEDLVIADVRGAVALAGVMGGEGSEVGPVTRELAVEAAVFQPSTVRRTARRLSVRTEASYRFERGVDPTGASAALERAAGLLAGLGGRPIGRILEAGGPPGDASPVPLVPKRLNALLGTAIEPQEMVRRLRAIGATVRRTHGETIEVTPPAHRLDLRQPADLAEEIARIGGYDAIPTRRPRIAARARPGAASGVRRIRNAFAAQGFAEALLLAFADPADNERFPGVWSQPTPGVELVNPLATLARELRKSLLPGLLAALRVNQSRGEAFVPLFSVGTVFALGDGGRPTERVALGAVVWGTPPAQIGRQAEPLGLLDLKYRVECALGAAGIAEPRWWPRADLGFLHPGRSAEMRLGETCVGWVGAAHPALGHALDLRAGDLWLIEADVEALLAAQGVVSRYVEPPRQPSVERDVALVVDDEVQAGALADALLRERHSLVENVVLFDEYRGAGVPAGRKSLAFTISYRAPDRTLTDAEVNAAHEELLRRLASGWRFERRGVASEGEG